MQEQLFTNATPGYFLMIGLAAAYACLALIVLFSWLSSGSDSSSQQTSSEIESLRNEINAWKETSQATLSQTRQVKVEIEQLRLRMEDVEHSLDEHLAESESPVFEPIATASSETTEVDPSLSLYEPTGQPPVTEDVMREASAEETSGIDEVPSVFDPNLGLVYLASPEQPDDLTMIWGIGGVNQTRLQENGIYFFHQIAQWTPEIIGKFDELLMFKGRIERETWVQQAQRLTGKSTSKAA